MVDGDKNIIERAIKGEAEAFGLLYDKYQPQIYRFVYLKVSHREEAEDLTHQVFLNAWRKMAVYRLDEQYPFSSWLYRIARNQVIDYYRTKKNNLDIASVSEIKISDPAIQSVDNRLDIERVKNAVGKLKPAHQDIIILRFVEDFSPQEIAVILNKTPLSVRLLQHRAIKKLRDILEKINE